MKLIDLEKNGIEFEEFVTIGNDTFWQLSDYKQYPYARWEAAENMRHAQSLRIMPITLDKALGEFDRLLNVAIKSDDKEAREIVGESISGGLNEIRKRLRMLPLPMITFRVVANLIFTEKELVNEAPSAVQVEERAQLFWDNKKKVLPRLFIAPMIDILKLPQSYKEDSEEQMESLINRMIAQQLMADYFDNLVRENLLLSLGAMS